MLPLHGRKGSLGNDSLLNRAKCIQKLLLIHASRDDETQVVRTVVITVVLQEWIRNVRHQCCYIESLGRYAHILESHT